MKKIILVALTGTLATAFFACQPEQKAQMETGSEQENAELIINLTSDPTVDPHSALMGLHLGQKVLKNDMDVTVFLNVHGVKLVGQGSDSLAFHGENLHEVVQSLLNSGGTVLACPHCMEVHEIQAEQLPEGIGVMSDSVMMKKMKGSPTVFTY